MEINLTHHAQTRAQQRGIKYQAIQACLEWGEQYFAGNGCIAFFINRRTVKYALKFKVYLYPFTNIAVIQTRNGDIATVQHTCRPVHSWKIA